MTPVEFEKLLVNYQRRLSPNAVLKHNQTIKGQSGTTNQCDATMSFSSGGIDFFVIFECKYHNKRVDLPKLREFKCKVDETGASKGVFVSKEGYTKQAKEFAHFHKIELYTLIDYELKDSKEILKIPINLEYIYPEKCYLEIFCALTNNRRDLNTIYNPGFDIIKGNGLIYNQKDNIWYTIGGFTEEMVSNRINSFLESSEQYIEEEYYFTPVDNIKTQEKIFSISLSPLKFKISLKLVYKKYYSWVTLDKLLGFDNLKTKTAYTLESKSFDIKDLIEDAEEVTEYTDTGFNIRVINKLLPQTTKSSYKFILDKEGNIELT